MNPPFGSRSLSTDFPIPRDNILVINPVIFLNTQHTVKPCMYILLCSDGSYYTGSTKNLYRRLAQHQAGEGANHTKRRLPVKLVYLEIYSRIDHAFYREKQVQKWRR